MSDSPYIFNVGIDDFDTIVIQGSYEQPVLVDFWASWCQPCQILMPVLSRLADEYQGAFHLAKVDTEAHPELSSRYGIRGIPAVKLFRNGEIVDEFTGALPEAEIRAFLDKHIEHESDRLASEALSALARGNAEQARELARKALAMDPQRLRVVADAARVFTASGDTRQAREAIAGLSPLDQQESVIKALLTEIELSKAGAKLPDAGTLRKRLDDHPEDHETRYQLAQRLAAEGQMEEALEQLLILMQKDKAWNNHAAQKMLVRLFDTLGDDPLVPRYRARMASLLY